MTLEEIFIAPLQYEFMREAIFAAILAGLTSGVVGAFVVVRGMSFFGDALAHSILPGVAIAYIYGTGASALPILSSIANEDVRLFIGGLSAGIFSAVLINWLTQKNRLKEDTAIGIIFVAMFALGIAIISTDPRAYQRDLTHILFGDIFGITESDLWIMIISTVVVIGTIILFFKELLVVSFDSGLAHALKLPSGGLQLLLLILVAVTIVANLQAVGVVLMLAMLITPAATAQLMTHRLHTMAMLSALIASICGVLGIYVAWHLHIAAAPAIVLVVTTLFAITFGITAFRKRVWHH
ncbi:MAG: metal ABC transporter permease [Phototrophicales bacterium]|nr:metal ABC transporter permease [Phototrophicales bacterium]